MCIYNRFQGLLRAAIILLVGVSAVGATVNPQQLFIGALGTYYSAIQAATCLLQNQYGGCSASFTDNFYTYEIYDLTSYNLTKGQQLTGTATLGCPYNSMSQFYYFEGSTNAYNSDYYKALSASDIMDVMTLGVANMSLLAEAACYTYAPCNSTYKTAKMRSQAASSFVNSQIGLYQAKLKKLKDTSKYCAHSSYGIGIMAAFQFFFTENSEVGALHDWQLRLNNTVTQPQVNATRAQSQLTALLPPGMSVLESWWLSTFFFNVSAYYDVFTSEDSPRSPTAVAIAAGTPAWLAGNMQNNTAKKAHGAAVAAANECQASTSEAVEQADTLLDGCTLLTGEIGTVMAEANYILKGGSPCSLTVAMLDQLFGGLEVAKVIQGVGTLTAPQLSTIVDEFLSVVCIFVPGAGEVELADLLLQLAVTTCDLSAVGLDVYKKQQSCCNTQCSSENCQNYFAYCLQSGSDVAC